MVTATDIQNLIILQVGDTPQGVLAAQSALVWSRYQDKASIAPRLQELYFHRDLIDLVLGSLRNEVGFSMSGDLSLHLEQRTKYLTDRREETCAEICKWEAIARAGRLPAIAPLVTTEMEPQPVLPLPTIVPDRNDEAFVGSPYWQHWDSGVPF